MYITTQMKNLLTYNSSERFDNQRLNKHAKHQYPEDGVIRYVSRVLQNGVTTKQHLVTSSQGHDPDQRAAMS